MMINNQETLSAISYAGVRVFKNSEAVLPPINIIINLRIRLNNYSSIYLSHYLPYLVNSPWLAIFFIT